MTPAEIASTARDRMDAALEEYRSNAASSDSIFRGFLGTDVSTTGYQTYKTLVDRWKARAVTKDTIDGWLKAGDEILVGMGYSGAALDSASISKGLLQVATDTIADARKAAESVFDWSKYVIPLALVAVILLSVIYLRRK